MFDTWEKKEREREGYVNDDQRKTRIMSGDSTVRTKNRDELLCPDYTHASGNYILQVLQGRGLRFAIV